MLLKVFVPSWQLQSPHTKEKRDNNNTETVFLTIIAHLTPSAIHWVLRSDRQLKFHIHLGLLG